MVIEKVYHGTGYHSDDWVEFIAYGIDGTVLSRRDSHGKWDPPTFHDPNITYLPKDKDNK